jgi:hypothetical protein
VVGTFQITENQKLADLLKTKRKERLVEYSTLQNERLVCIFKITETEKAIM